MKILDLFGLGGDVFKAQKDFKIAKINAEKDRFLRRIESDDTWEGSTINAASAGWLDEYWTVILSVPLIMSFIPGYAKYVAEGFENMTITPEWYQWAVLASISFAFGRKALPFVGFKRK